MKRRTTADFCELVTRVVETMIVIESFYKYRITFAIYVKRIHESWKLTRHSE